MNRDNLLFATIGILVGFIAGYLMHEVMASRQPQRLTPELRAQLVGPGGETGPAPAEGDAGAAPAEAPAANPGVAAPAGGGGTGPAMQAIQELKDYVDKNPNDAKAVRRLADLNFDISNWQRAQELYRRYLELQPNDPDVLTDLGISYRETKDFNEALKHFQAAQKVAPDHWQAYYNQVVVLAFDLKKLDEANQVLAKLQQLQPGNPDVEKLAGAVAKQRSAA